MNIFTYIKKDHRIVEQIFSEIIEASSVKRRQSLLKELKGELLVHTEAEHKTFYKLLKKHAAAKEQIKHCDKEHEKIKMLIGRIEKSQPKSAEWLVHLGALKYIVEHHVEEEEKKVFKLARSLLTKDEINKLAKLMDQKKLQYIEEEGI